MILSVPQLLAQSMNQECFGESRCFYCAAPCGETHSTKAYVKESFTGRSGVRAPGSLFVCNGCVLCLREDAEIDQIDGARRRVPKGCMRAFSWVITEKKAMGGTKSHFPQLRAACLNPPDPPFAIVLSDSGKTHQLYRGVVNHDPGQFVVTLESDPINCSASSLASRLVLCGRIASATGKPALLSPVDFRLASAVMGRFRDGESLVSEWSRVQGEPLSRLASWLCPNKEECLLEYSSDL